MPRLRNLSGSEVVDILTRLGFEVIRIKGSHHRLRYAHESNTCYTSIPVHGKTPLPIGTLRSIYRQAAPCISDETLRPYFFAD